MKVYPLQCGLVVGEEAPAQGAPSAMELGCSCVGCQDACSSSRHSPLLCPILIWGRQHDEMGAYAGFLWHS